MNCESLVFHGGDPLLDPADLLTLVEYCRDGRFEGTIYVLTNGERIDAEMADLLSRLAIHPVIPVDVSGDTLIGTAALAHVSTLLRERAVDFGLTFVSAGDVAGGQSIERFVEDLGAARVNRVAVLQEGDAGLRHALSLLRKKMMRVSPSVFYHNVAHHPCLHQTLAVSPDGQLLPCPHLRSETLGSIANSRTVDRVFESKSIDRYWNMDLSQVDSCRDCGFLCGCVDCRAVESQVAGDLYGKRFCPFPAV